MEVKRENIDKILEMVTQTTKNAIKKSGEAVEVTKIRLAINSDKSKIKELKLQVGELMYEAYSGNASSGDEIEELCQEISELYKEIERKEQAIAEIKNLRRCSKCGANNEIDAYFCKKCAAELKTDDASVEADVVVEDTENNL